jgi:hypothetical protein
LRPILEAESGNGAKGPIIGHEHRIVLDRMGCDEQVERAERPAGRSSSARTVAYRRAVALLQARTSIAANI